MKKFVYLIIVTSIFFILSGCENNSKDFKNQNTTKIPEESTTNDNAFELKLNEMFELISSKKIKLDLLKEDFIDEEISNNKYSVVTKIIEEVKKYDKNFKEENYKISYQLNKNKGNGWIKLVYFIDGKIKTNKIYTAAIEHNEVIRINLTNVLKENLKKISLVNEKRVG